jgi:small-conductance mechanosensitive channel
MNSKTQGNHSPRRPAWALVIVFGFTLLFWLITFSWHSADYEPFTYPFESMLLATVVALTVAIAFSTLGRVQLSRLCLGIGIVGLVVSAALWYKGMITGYT